MIDSWSVFELCVTTFCKGITTSNELNSLLESNYLEIINMLKNTKINPKDEAKIRKQNIKKSLTHISINRKINFLFKKVNNYGRDINSDKNFLVFFAKFRNTLHTNFIYYGNHYEYKFNEAHFVFENEKLVKWYDPWFRSPILYFNLLTELNNIWREIINCIEHQEIVNYPDEEQD